jgi:hypothetical protein
MVFRGRCRPLVPVLCLSLVWWATGTGVVCWNLGSVDLVVGIPAVFQREDNTMTSTLIFIVGLFVTAITFTGALLVGLQEAADTTHSRPEDLTGFEKKLVDRPDVD